ncbi:MAG: 2Fe-2S iron-sulfur cluster binding domain-containing protein [Acidocella sp.]|nr:2Fe-2S iron-sulfur cluster binding domain-containing protein [Acidocella sp.]
MAVSVSAAFTVTVEGVGEATCYPGERVLVALERAQGFGRLKGLCRKLPVGCRRGGCGVCRARIIQGDYRAGPMSRAHVSQTDEAAGVVLSCAIYALSDLTLRFEAVAVRTAESAACCGEALPSHP